MGIKERPDLSVQIPEEQQRQSGPLSQFGAGIPIGTAQMVDTFTNLMLMGARQIPGIGNAAGAVSDPRLNLSPVVRERIERSVAPPQTTGQRMARAAGVGVGETLPTLPLAMLGAPSRAAMAARGGLDLASGVSAEVARERTEAMGFGPKAQFAASLGAGMGPGMFRVLGRRAVQGALPPARASAGRRLAAETLGREVQDRGEAVRMLADEIRTKPFNTRASTAQVLEEVAPGIRTLEKSVARSGAAGRDFAREAFNLRRANKLAAQEAFESGFRAGQPGAATEAWIRASDVMDAKVRAAWKGLRNLEGIPTSRVKESARFIRSEAGEELSRSMPKQQLRIIDKYGDTVDLASLRRLRSAVSQRIRGAVRDPERAQEVFFLEQIKNSIDDTFDDVARIGGNEDIAALRKAIALRAEKGMKFPPKSKANKAMREFDDLGRGFRSILSSRRPVQEVRLLKNAFGDDPEAWAGIQRLMREEVFGEGLEGLNTAGRVRSAARRLSRHSDAFDEVYGPGASKNARRFLDRLAQIQSGVVGTSAEAAVTGSNVERLQAFMQNSGVVADMARGRPAEAALRVIGLVKGNSPKTLAEAERLLAQALVDPQVAKGFLETLPDQAVPIWAERVNRFLSRPTRALAGTGMDQ